MGIRGSGMGKSFTVGRVELGCWWERIFLFTSPSSRRLEVLRRGPVEEPEDLLH